MRKATKSCYIDTNLLIYLQNKDSVFHSETVLIFKKLVEEDCRICISSLTIDEYLYNTYRLLEGSRLDKLKVLSLNLKRVFKMPGIKLINPSLEVKKHTKVVNLMRKFNLRPRDAYHLFITLENKIKYFATFDHDFDKVFEKGSIQKFE